MSEPWRGGSSGRGWRLLWRHFCANHGSPVVIVLRGLRRPLVFRFYGPFQLAKHGDAANLKALEAMLMAAVTAARDA